jgi:2-polyprenyl-3-methyl-5-hydroxy-6-metoxy-1,4-benzoquinol methylase
MINVKTFLEQAQNPDFWKSLNPQLSVGEDFSSLSGSVLSLEQEHMEKLLFNLKNEGYFQIDSFLSEAEISRMAAGIEKLRESGLPVPFAFIYDEFWQTFCRLSQILSVILGEEYRQLPAFWAWYINTTNSEKGWQPHRDNGGNTLLPDGMPKCVTIWIPLSDAIPLNGCMYILPAPFDRNYGGNVQKGEKKEIINFQDIRALPATAGSVLCWNHAVLHWGSRSSERAPHPRLSLAFEFQRSDVEAYKTPLLNPSNPPNFNQRLALIGKQILQYQHMYPLSEELAELATELQKESLLSSTKFPNNLPMNNEQMDVSEKIRQQFDTVCYPRTPLEQSPKDNYVLLYIHNLVTPYYLRHQKVIKTEGKVILDAGCGSGYKSLILAEANPGAKIVGIDLSEESVKLARQRLEYHGFGNAEFHALSIEDLPSLGLEFDFINNDEVLYLLPDPVVGLQAMKSVLKPHGIIRTNVHSYFQRASFFRAQKFCKLMGLMDENPQDLEIEMVRETMNALKNEVLLKARNWSSNNTENDEWIFMNYLLQGDKGYTIPEVFAALRSADLEFVSMVGWRHWDVTELFQDLENLPAFIAMSLPEISVEDRLHMFELLHPVHRLIDFWCAHPNQAQSSVPVSEWTERDWQQAQVHLHPQLRTAQLKEDLIHCIAGQKPFIITHYIPLPATVPIAVESTMAACLLPLWEGTQPIMSLVERWLKLRPFDPTTLEPVSRETAFDQVKELLSRLEAFLYVLLEYSA